jgi:hypothetical protein
MLSDLREKIDAKVRRLAQPAGSNGLPASVCAQPVLNNV